jgi:hypothetical protein
MHKIALREASRCALIIRCGVLIAISFMNEQAGALALSGTILVVLGFDCDRYPSIRQVVGGTVGR